MKKIITESTAQTQAFGNRIGLQVQTGLSISLTGDLGAGKTTFVQGLARGVGVPDNAYVTSPTFSIINEYPDSRIPLYHIDLYRLGSPDELEYIGFHDIPVSESLIVVEWPMLLKEDDFRFDLEITITFDDSFNRCFHLVPATPLGKGLVDNLK